MHEEVSSHSAKKTPFKKVLDPGTTRGISQKKSLSKNVLEQGTRDPPPTTANPRKANKGVDGPRDSRLQAVPSAERPYHAVAITPT